MEKINRNNPGCILTEIVLIFNPTLIGTYWTLTVHHVIRFANILNQSSELTAGPNEHLLFVLY